MSYSSTTAIFTDNYFTSLDIVRVGKTTLKTIKQIVKKSTRRGTVDYTTSDGGILAVRWKDNKVFTLLSTDLGVELMSGISRYCSDTKQRKKITCPSVIKNYNANMGGTDKK
ncbi:hypothetical protein O3P69_009975 [Scylla paramamosain]|uniref:PiggyBac transposable element-derived protein domain-containing protein n=1 Tax=Scylla paramamosain TaxID=85552 RepID=A0AAW0SNI7_SCYPA